ncbi:hypothetical protein J42TS3_51170 [Paenibacillus vini]|uniref:Major facilitator superfamily (MFS) profile domain-containing protein n=1 Tax=Paenibacillus vini TaxID=1476024 RepID=A0ABQ4MK93_9BACL|nr:hypothetical protein J42TS3_51170 [Paenibacillus vini]
MAKLYVQLLLSTFHSLSRGTQYVSLLGYTFSQVALPYHMKTFAGKSSGQGLLGMSFVVQFG